MELKIDPEFKNLIPPLSSEEYQQLEDNIKKDGCRDPLVVWNGVIVDGHNRYEICKKNNILFEIVKKNFGCIEDACIWIIDNQKGRRNLVPYVKIELELKKSKYLTQKGLDNIKNAHLYNKVIEKEKPTFQKSEKMVSSNIQNPITNNHVSKIEPVNTVKTIAKETGSSADTVSKVIKITKKAPEEVKQKLRDGEMSINQAYITITRQENEEKQKEQQEQPNAEVELPTGKFKCLVIDPPWDVKKILRDSRPNQAEFAYKTMSDDEISELPIENLSEDDCHLYLWTTHKKLPTALKLVEMWGFKYQCLMTWVKNVGFTPFSWMYSTEHVLFCRRGNLDLNQKGMRLDFNAKVREHSRKPDEFYDLVLKASPEPRLELFSREHRQGFETWGNETNKFSSVGQNNG